MRRRITGALLTFILLTVLLLLQLPAAGAEKIPASRCSHSNKSLMRSQDPTCTEAGYMYHRIIRICIMSTQQAVKGQISQVTD